MENVPKELIKTQSIAVRDIQIGCRRRENGKPAACTKGKPEEMGLGRGVCGQTAWGHKVELTTFPGTCPGIPFNRHSLATVA